MSERPMSYEDHLMAEQAAKVLANESDRCWLCGGPMVLAPSVALNELPVRFTAEFPEDERIEPLSYFLGIDSHEPFRQCPECDKMPGMVSA